VRPHDVDVLSLMAGVGFAGIAAIALLGDGGLGARWTCPLLLILMGLVGLVASQRSSKP